MFVWIRALDAKIENTVSYRVEEEMSTHPKHGWAKLINEICMYERVYDGSIVKAMEFIGGYISLDIVHRCKYYS
jgi:hypothetical protein